MTKGYKNQKWVVQRYVLEIQVLRISKYSFSTSSTLLNLIQSTSEFRVLSRIDQFLQHMIKHRCTLVNHYSIFYCKIYSNNNDTQNPNISDLIVFNYTAEVYSTVIYFLDISNRHLQVSHFLTLYYRVAVICNIYATPMLDYGLPR